MAKHRAGSRWFSACLGVAAFACAIASDAFGASSCVTPDSGTPVTTCYFDLTSAPSTTQSPASAVLNGGMFRVPSPGDDLGGAVVGTGVFQPFLRIQANGVEAGFNTDGSGRQLDNHDNGGSNWNHSIKLNDIPLVTVCDGGGSTGTNCQQYYQFLLDINEQANSTDAGVSLDDFKVYLGATGSITASSATGQCSQDGSNGGSFALCGATEVYDMDQIPGGDASILMDYRNFSGSGKGVDLEALVPTANFGGALPDSYVYLYSKFGATGSNCSTSGGANCQTPGGALASAAGNLNYGSDAGFEEWSIRKVARVSLPSSLLTLALGLFGLAALRGRVNAAVA